MDQKEIFERLLKIWDHFTPSPKKYGPVILDYFEESKVSICHQRLPKNLKSHHAEKLINFIDVACLHPDQTFYLIGLIDGKVEIMRSSPAYEAIRPTELLSLIIVEMEMRHSIK